MPDELDQMLSSVEDCWSIARRRRWWILLPIFLSWAAVWGSSWLIPSTFQSEALILLKQQNVPNQYVVPNVSATPQDRLQTISQQVLSRTRLQATIDHFHLYPEHHGIRALIPSGDPIERMRKDIEIELVAAPGHADEFTSFKMRYTAVSPQLAQMVNAELTLPFVHENVEAQQQLSEDTTSFLETQLADARAKMEEQETKVAAFKAKHLNELPGQLQMNGQQILNAIQTQLQNTHQSLEAARQHKVYLESLGRQYQSARGSQGDGGNGIAGGAEGSTLAPAKVLDRELTDLRLRLQDLQERYTDDYPDVVALKGKIADKVKQKKFAENDMAGTPGGRNAANIGAPSASKDFQNGSLTSMPQLESQLNANQLEIQNYQKRESVLEAQISAYLARLNVGPEAEQELEGISRGYEESKTNYNSLLQKQMQSQLATSLEQRQKGEQFRLLDPASLPNKHLAPNRFKFSLGGLALGFALGIGMVAVLELSDIRVRQEKDFKALVKAPLLVSIPRLSTQSEENAFLKGQRLDFCVMTIIVTLIAVGNIYAFYRR